MAEEIQKPEGEAGDAPVVKTPGAKKGGEAKASTVKLDQRGKHKLKDTVVFEAGKKHPFLKEGTKRTVHRLVADRLTKKGYGSVTT